MDERQKKYWEELDPLKDDHASGGAEAGLTFGEWAREVLGMIWKRLRGEEEEDN